MPSGVTRPSTSGALSHSLKQKMHGPPPPLFPVSPPPWPATTDTARRLVRSPISPFGVSASPPAGLGQPSPHHHGRGGSHVPTPRPTPWCAPHTQHTDHLTKHLHAHAPPQRFWVAFPLGCPPQRLHFHRTPNTTPQKQQQLTTRHVAAQASGGQECQPGLEPLA